MWRVVEGGGLRGAEGYWAMEIRGPFSMEDVVRRYLRERVNCLGIQAASELTRLVVEYEKRLFREVCVEKLRFPGSFPGPARSRR